MVNDTPTRRRLYLLHIRKNNLHAWQKLQWNGLGNENDGHLKIHELQNDFKQSRHPVKVTDAVLANRGKRTCVYHSI